MVAGPDGHCIIDWMVLLVLVVVLEELAGTKLYHHWTFKFMAAAILA
jgi:hypothetical protein